MEGGRRCGWQRKGAQNEGEGVGGMARGAGGHPLDALGDSAEACLLRREA